MKKKFVRRSASNRPQGHGLLPVQQSHDKAVIQSRRDAAVSGSLEKAKEYAFFLLKFRLRSEHELISRLRQKGFTEEACRETVNFLRDRRFIDDRVFAKGWVASRLKRPFGLKRIKGELLQKGLAKEIIEEAFTQAEKEYDELSVVKDLAGRRFGRLKSIDPLKARQRVYGYLLRRGFSPDSIKAAVKGFDE